MDVKPCPSLSVWYVAVLIHESIQTVTNHMHLVGNVLPVNINVLFIHWPDEDRSIRLKRWLTSQEQMQRQIFMKSAVNHRSSLSSEAHGPILDLIIIIIVIVLPLHA